MVLVSSALLKLLIVKQDLNIFEKHEFWIFEKTVDIRVFESFNESTNQVVQEIFFANQPKNKLNYNSYNNEKKYWLT